MRSLLIGVLHCFTRRILARYQPLVIGITGSVGKTSTKDALTHILRSAGKRVAKSPASFNTDVGIPLAVLGFTESPGRSIVAWARVYIRACALAFYASAEFPEIIVLEMGADRPGDIEALVRLAHPRMGILTAVAPVHLEGFGTLEQIRLEKQKILTTLPAGGTAILPSDDAALPLAVRKEMRVQSLTVGTVAESDIRVFEVRPNVAPIGGLDIGTYFKLAWKGSVVPCFVPTAVGIQSVRSVGFAAAAGLALEMNLISISDAIKSWVPPPGRMRVLPGIKKTTLIDDTYNSSPRAVEAALDTIATVEWPGRRIVCLADMAELGSSSERAHADIGRAVALGNPDLFLAVGAQMVAAYRALLSAGYPKERAFHWDDAEAAGRFLQERLQSSDLVLIKGSQVMRMERVVKELMAEPLRAEELLVRQGKNWKDK